MQFDNSFLSSFFSEVKLGEVVVSEEVEFGEVAEACDKKVCNLI